ncbi:MAG: imidazolonepropionase [Spongiibacteraceae bacterium]|nr:imidazolonepropionase [Spongiibacteraceae bacterium]
MQKGLDENGVITDGALAVSDGKIAWLGSMNQLPLERREMAGEVIDVAGQWLTPGLVDCHTHLIYGGDRVEEFEKRLEGMSYEDIASNGGGILSTVMATRQASESQLFNSAAKRLQVLMAEGVTTVEIKSGYGLELDCELRMLRVARSLGQALPVDVRTTCLAAHTLPPEFQGCRDAYIDLVCEHILPAAARENLADAVDAYCEGIGFRPHEVKRVFRKAQSLGLPLKLHADQLSDLGGAALAAQFQALSVDHMEFSSLYGGVHNMAHQGCVAVLLPGPSYFLRQSRCPPIDLLRELQVPMAIATDANPGTCPTASLLLMMNMACTLFRLTPWEVWRGVTCHAARALGLKDRGILAPGLRADMAMWSMNSLAEVCYCIGHAGPVQIIRVGEDL